MDCESVREGRLEALYGEADGPTLELVRKHEAACALCREESAAFGALRRDLAQWTLFEPAAHRAVARPLVPRWLAVAATVLLALGGSLGLARPEVTWSDGSVRLSFGDRADASRTLAVDADRRQQIESLRAALERVEARPLAAATSFSDRTDIEALLKSSEERQRRAFETRFETLSGQLATQRRVDFARMSAGLAYLDQRSGRDVARTNELMGYVLQASQRR